MSNVEGSDDAVGSGRPAVGSTEPEGISPPAPAWMQAAVQDLRSQNAHSMQVQAKLGAQLGAAEQEKVAAQEAAVAASERARKSEAALAASAAREAEARDAAALEMEATLETRAAAEREVAQAQIAAREAEWQAEAADR